MADCKIIDVHHHAFPPEAPVRPWTIETDTETMERHGITDVLLSCPLQTEAASAHHMNEFLFQQIAMEPKHHRMLGVLPYDDTVAALEEISYVLDECGAVGFSLNTHNHDIYIGNDKLNPVFDELNRRKAVVVLHPCHHRAPGNEKLVFTGNDSVYEYTFDTTRAVMDFVFQDKVSRWGDIRWVLPHAGGTIPFLAHRISVSGYWGSIRQSEEVILKTIKSFYYDLALNHSEVNYAFMKEFVGADHLLFGSDYPNSGETLLNMDITSMQRTAVFTDEEKEQILHCTAERLFGSLEAI